MRTRISCPFGLVGILTQEIKRLECSIIESDRTGLWVETDIAGIYRINLRSRIANKVMQEVSQKYVTTFDQVFNRVQSQNWPSLINPKNPVTIKVLSKGSILESVPALQSVVHKAILTSMHGEQTIFYEKDIDPTEVILYLDKNRATILINTSGSSLHQRGRRRKTGDAPIKENIAAAMILQSGWRFRNPLRDPFCGSGTIAIEAALIASNRAPGLQRDFAFQLFPSFDETLWEIIKKDAKDKIFKEGSYDIIGYDNDPEMVAIALENARYAKVDHLVNFEQRDFLVAPETLCDDDGKTWIVTNPPYGKRIEIYGKIYEELVALAERKEAHVAMVTLYEGLEKLTMKEDRTVKTMMNGTEEVGYWRSV